MKEDTRKEAWDIKTKKGNIKMLGLFSAIIIFNVIAFKTNKNLTHKQIAHIWVFTIAFQMSVDVYLDVKYQAYWYFTQNVDWGALPAHTVLIPPVNMMFLNWYPRQGSNLKKIGYIVVWEIPLLVYELLTMLPEPWGYFSYGWWNLGYSALLNPLLLFILSNLCQKTPTSRCEADKWGMNGIFLFFH